MCDLSVSCNDEVSSDNFLFEEILQLPRAQTKAWYLNGKEFTLSNKLLCEKIKGLQNRKMQNHSFNKSKHSNGQDTADHKTTN